MIQLYENNEAVLVFILRIILGILFFFQGYDKVFNIKMPGVIETFNFELGTIKINKWFMIFAAYFTSYVELIAGFLLLVGFFKTIALYALGIDLIIVTVALSIIKPMWNMETFFPRLIILCTLLYLPHSWDILSIDYLLKAK